MSQEEMLLQHILDQIKELRIDLSQNVVRKPEYDVKMKEIDDALAENSGQFREFLPRTAIGVSCVSALLTILSILHIIK